MVYEKYLEQFDKIGYSEDRINIIPNFIDKNTLEMINRWITKSEKTGAIERENIEDQWVIDFLIDTQERIYLEAHKRYTDVYNVEFEKEPFVLTHLIKWDLGLNSPMPVHADCEGPDGKPAMANAYYKYNLATICYLNDNYDGGEIFFPQFNKTIKPNAGDLIMFPGRFRHGVNGVKSGDRHTMLTWFRFDVEDNLKWEEIPVSKSALGVLFEEIGN